jgi:hypothetical protein
LNRITAIIAIGFALAVASQPASAQNGRSFVSGHGSDAAACTLAAPCRTLAHAITVTNSGGEIDVLDAAGYGALTINKAISIVNDGVGTAGVIVPSGGIGITINAGVNDAVSLRGLSVEGGGIGATGIKFNTGQSLSIRNCVIRHVTQDGILFAPNAASNMSMSNSSASDNAQNGIHVTPIGSSPVTMVFSRVQVINNTNAGILMDGQASTGTLKATAFRSLFDNNAAAVWAITASGKASTSLMMAHSAITNNGGNGVVATGVGALIRVTDSTVSGNFLGWSTTSSGIVQSYGNNSIDGNVGGETAPPSIAKK